MFVALDGIDGSGKGTLIAILQKVLERDGRQVLVTKQPGGSPLGDEIRRILFASVGTANIEPDALELLFLANHIHNTRTVVEPALAAGKFVLADRHWPSAVAYMDERGASPHLRELYASYRGISHDVLFLLVGAPDVLLARAQARTRETHQAAKKWNSARALEKVQQSFVENFASLPNTCVVDVTRRKPGQIVEDIMLPRLGFSAEQSRALMNHVRARHRDLLLVPPEPSRV